MPNTCEANNKFMLRESLNRLLIGSFVTAAAAFVTGCGLDQKGMILFTDPSYRATVVGTDRDGFTVPDGIRWSQGRFLIADEGGSAFRIWSGPGHVTTLCDSKNGVMSPEDMAVDAGGNIYFTDDDAGGVAHGEAVAEALLLLAQRLHERQQIRQRLAAPCTTTRANTLVPKSLITRFASSQNAKFTLHDKAALTCVFLLAEEFGCRWRTLWCHDKQLRTLFAGRNGA